MSVFLYIVREMENYNLKKRGLTKMKKIQVKIRALMERDHWEGS